MDSEKQVDNERGWRDIALSQWRKSKLDWEIAANDIDMMLVEYTKGVPVAFIEFKMEDRHWRDVELAATKWVADKCGLPFFVVQYSKQLGDWFKVIPKNDKAVEKIGTWEMLTERQFVCLLYWLRGLRPSSDLLAKLKDTLPTMTAEERAHHDAEFEAMTAALDKKVRR